MTHAVERIDDVVHQRVRLGVMAILGGTGHAEFNYLKSELGLTAGNLSRHLSVLAEAGYVRIDKSFVRTRPRTWVRITGDGRAALRREVAALHELLGQEL